jgi:O-antigen/teichoic acid export membrane protein
MTGLAMRMVRSSAARVIGLLAGLAVTFFMTPLVVRTFGDHWYGLLVIAGGVTNYYYLLDFGLSAAASRYISVRMAEEDQQGLNEVVSTALVIFTVLGLLVALITVAVVFAAGALAAPADVATLRLVILLQGLGLAVGFPVKAYGGIVYANFRHDLIEAYGLVRLVVETSIVLYLLTHGYGIVAYVIVGTISGQCFNVFFYWTAVRLCPQLRVSTSFFRRDLTKQLFGYSLWSLLDQVSDNLRFRIDSLVVAGYAGASMVTHFSIGARLCEYTLTLINRATNFMSPLYAGYHARQDYTELQAKLLAFTRLNSLLAMCGGGLLIALGEVFIVHWMGEAYRDAYPVMVALIIGLVAEAILMPSSNALYGMAKQQVYAVASAIEAAANVALSIYLVQRMGIVGVAWGTTIPLLVNKLIVIPVYTCRTVGLPVSRFYRTLLPTAMVTGGVLATLYIAVHAFIEVRGYAGILIAAAAPIAPLAILGFMFLLTREERELLARVASVRLFRRLATR